MRSPSVWLLLLLAGLVLGNLWVTLQRSGVPLAIDGRIEAIEVRPEKHPGLDDVHLVTVGARELHLDAAIAEHLEVGQVVRKGAWSSELSVGARHLALEPSQDFWRMMLTMPAIALLAGVLLLRRWRPAIPEA